MSDRDVNQAETGYSLKFLVHPNPFYRLRYATEKIFRPLKGFNAPYPKVQLQHPHLMEEESETEAFIRVYVLTVSCEPHVHKIVTKESGTTDGRLKDHADMTISSQNDFQAEFRNLIIIRRSQSEWIEEEVTRQKNECMGTDLPIAVEEFTNQAEQTWQRMDHSQFRLGFYAYKRGCSGCPDILLCGPLFSRVISNQDDPSVGELKITRMSACSGKRGDELFLLVSKIATKSKVKVRFFEGDPNKPSWEEYAQEIHLHHQVALVVGVPPYKEDIQAQVQVQLVRTKSDGSINRSDARIFSYRPLKLSGKRRLSTPPDYSSLVNERRSRTTGGSSSEDNIQVQRGGQQLNTVQSCPNVNWQNQGSNLQSSLVEESTSSQNMQQLLYDFHLSDGQEMASSIEPNNQEYTMLCEGLIQIANELTNQQYSVPQIAGYPSIEPNSQLNEPEDVPNLDFMLPQSYDWQNQNVTWGVDLAADATDEKKKTTGEEKPAVVTDGIGKNNARGSTSLKPNKDMSCTAATTQQASLSLFQVAMIFQVVMTGDARKLEKLLKCKTETEKKRFINKTNGQDQTPLIIAVEQNHHECVELLCSAGASVNLADEEENTPYHIAAKKNYNKCLETLLKVEDRELDKKNIKGEAALHLAVLYNSVESVKMLLNAGANVNEKNYTAGSTPLHLAVQHGYTQLVRHLLEHKNIKIHEVNYEGKTAAASVKSDQEDIISLFKELQGITVTMEEETSDEDE